ncbi:MAG: type II toxin-antitoxin system HicB family antitoxin [Selenomonadaceae bacterium]|nr:type II toxin-antitoxin system HicB family antitoxin [Selenomonadaceae bacterium]
MKYVYPAIFRKDAELDDCYVVEFPDLNGVFTQGYGLFEAIYMAEDVLAFSLMLDEDDGENIPKPTPIDQVKAEPDEYSTDAFVTLIKADTDVYRLLVAERSLL